jgi:putative ABC transport system permease protein
MPSPRWLKLLRDVAAERGRVSLMIVAIAASLTAVGAVLGAHAILTREIAVNYLGTRPASATLELPDGVDRALLEELRKRPEIEEAEARDTLLARVRVGRDVRPLLVFVIDDFRDLRLNTFRPEAGAFPPPDGTLLLERSALGMVEAGLGRTLRVWGPNGRALDLPISGTVHDPGLAPAWQERMGYAYVTRATIERLGEPRELRELRVAFRGAADRPSVEREARELARWLAERGHAVEEIRVPEPGKHPHQLQMVTVLFLLGIFAALALVLSAILAASSLSAMLARQVREIGVMKTLGARRLQIASLYLALVAALSDGSLLLALPLGVGGAKAFAGVAARMLNFELTNTGVPWASLAIQIAAGVLVPTSLALLPILRASHATIRESLDQHGTGSVGLRRALSRLPRSLRNAARRPLRLALTLSLLAAGGAMFMMALNLRASWVANLDEFYQVRHYDLELRLQRPEPLALREALLRVPGVRTVEAWGYSPTSFTSPGQVEVSSAYPDGRHATLSVQGAPPGTQLLTLPVLEGRWLSPNDPDAVVLNHSARTRLRGAKLGDLVWLTVSGRPTQFRLVGVVKEIGAAATAYISDRAFEAAASLPGKARLLRVATDATSPAERAEILRAVEAELEGLDVAVEQGTPLSEHRTAVGDHIVILIRALVAMAVVMALVGTLGLASAMSVSVIERTGELAVMKAMGATPRRISRDLIAEAAIISVLSWGLSFLLSLPLTLYIDRLIGNLGFLASLPFVVEEGAALGWLGMSVAISLLATWLPARHAGRLTIRDALAHT